MGDGASECFFGLFWDLLPKMLSYKNLVKKGRIESTFVKTAKEDDDMCLIFTKI